MFERRDLPEDLGAVRDEHANDALVFDCEQDVETLSATHLDELAARVDDVDPVTYATEWVPGDAPDLLHRIAGPDLVIGLPEHGGITYTRQTDPPVVLVRPRTRGSDAGFRDFLIAEALVTLGLDFPEHFLGFFEERYRELAGLSFAPADVYQIAAALFAAYRGLFTKEAFAAWADERPRLHDAWADAGERLEPRLSDLPTDLARGETDFADATELACSAVKHDLGLPEPFGPLNTAAYREHGADFARTWAMKVAD